MTASASMADDFEKARGLFVQGIADFEAGRFDAARLAFEASLVLLPGRVSTLTNLAATHIQLHAPEAALRLLDQALASQPQDQDAWWQRAMALDAGLMLFDEPTSSLDPEWVGEVLDLMRRVAALQQTMLIVTHEMQFAREIADRMIFMDGGRVVEQGPPAQLFDAPRDKRTESFLRRVR